MRRKLNIRWMAVLVIMLIMALVPVLFAASVYPLPMEGKADTGANYLVVVTHADLTETTANTAQSLTNVLPVLAKQGVELIACRLVTAFTDDATTAFSSVAVTVGDGTDADLYLTSTELDSYGTEVWLKFGRTGWDGGAATSIVFSGADTNTLTTQIVYTVSSPLTEVGRKLYTAADYVDFVFTPTAAYALSALDNGEVWFYFRILDAN